MVVICIALIERVEFKFLTHRIYGTIVDLPANLPSSGILPKNGFNSG